MSDVIVQSQATRRGGIRGFVIGAIAGAIVANLIAYVFVAFNVGAGGQGVHTAAGAAFGGLVGLLYAAIRASWRAG